MFFPGEVWLALLLWLRFSFNTNSLGAFRPGFYHDPQFTVITIHSPLYLLLHFLIDSLSLLETLRALECFVYSQMPGTQNNVWHSKSVYKHLVHFIK